MPTHTHQHTKAQTSPSEIFNHTSKLASPLPPFIILSPCLSPCPFARIICYLCCLSFLPFLLFICSVISTEPSSAHGQNILGTALPDLLYFLVFLECLPCTLLYTPPPVGGCTNALPPPRAVHLLGENPLSSSILPPSVLSLSLSLCLFISSNIFSSLLSPHAPALYSLT